VAPMADAILVKRHRIERREAAEAWSTRRSWLVPGAVLTAIFSWMFVVGLVLQPALAVVGLVLVIGSYAAMIGAAIWIRPRDRRNGVLAWLLATQATTAVAVLVSVLILEAGRLIGAGAL